MEIQKTGKPRPPKSVNEILAEVETEPKPRRRRKKPEPETVKVNPEVIGHSFKLGFRIGFMITNFEGWKLTDEEKSELVEVWQPIFDRYIGPNFEEYILWFNAIGALGGTVFKKVKLNQAYNEEQAKKKKESRTDNVPV